MPILLVLLGVLLMLAVGALTMLIIMALGAAVAVTLVANFLLLVGAVTIAAVTVHYVTAAASAAAPGGLSVWALVATIATPVACVGALSLTGLSLRDVAGALVYGPLLLLPLVVANWAGVVICYVVCSLFMGAPATTPVANDPTDLAGRRVMIGMNACVDLVLGFVVYMRLLSQFTSTMQAVWIGLAIASLLFMIALLAAFPVVGAPAKRVLGWTGFLRPSAWPVTLLGGAMYWVSHVLHLFSLPFGTGFLTVQANSVVGESGSIMTTGGLCANLNLINTAYNMGTYSLHDVASGTPLRTVRHEAGHQLNLAAFGYHFHYVGFVDQVIQGILGFLGIPPFAGTRPLSERLAESNVPLALDATRPRLIQW